MLTPVESGVDDPLPFTSAYRDRPLLVAPSLHRSAVRSGSLVASGSYRYAALHCSPNAPRDADAPLRKTQPRGGGGVIWIWRLSCPESAPDPPLDPSEAAPGLDTSSGSGGFLDPGSSSGASPLLSPVYRDPASAASVMTTYPASHYSSLADR